MAGEQRVFGDWLGQQVQLTPQGDEYPRVGTLTDVRDDGVELAEEEHPQPYGEDQAQQGTPTFYGYDSIVEVRSTEDD